MSQKASGITTKDFRELLKTVKNIESKLDVIVSLQKASIDMPNVGTEEEKILKLCDKKHTIADMMQVTSKKEGTINATLNHLKGKAMIRTVIVDSKTVYERIR